MIYILPIAGLAFLAAVLLVPAWLQNRTRLETLRLVHAAIAQGQALDTGVVDRLLAPPKPQRSTNWFALICFFFGLLSLAVGIALMTGAVVWGRTMDPSGRTGAGMTLGAMINGFSGLAQTLLGVAAVRVFGRHPANEGLATWFAQGCLFLGVSGTAVGIALALGARFLGGQIGLAPKDAGMMLGALITGFSGLGLVALGVVVLRLLGRDPDA
jgi:hypothetical protein